MALRRRVSHTVTPSALAECLMDIREEKEEKAESSSDCSRDSREHNIEEGGELAIR